MTDWTAFAGFSGVVVLLLLALARASQSMLPEAASGSGDAPAVPTERDYYERAATTDEGPAAATPNADSVSTDVDGVTTDVDAVTADATNADGPVRPTREETGPPGPTTTGAPSVRDGQRPSEQAGGANAATRSEPTSPDDRTYDLRRFGSGELLANVLVTHGLFAVLVAAAAVYWRVPASALGVAPPSLRTVGWGVATGLALYVGNEGGAAVAARLGIDHEETLRELLAPESPAGWVILLGGALPVVAIGEELIFRGVLVGALSTGFSVPVWGLAVASSVAFALGHGAQGTGGVVVTGLLGFALAAAFVVSGSLLLVIVAHYVVNALEFVVHEGLGIEWAE